MVCMKRVVKLDANKLCAKIEQSREPDSVTREKSFRPYRALSNVLPYRITPEYNRKIRPQPDRENAFARASSPRNKPGSPGLRTWGRPLPPRSGLFSLAEDRVHFLEQPQIDVLIDVLIEA